MIDALSDSISLEDEEAILLAREAFDKLPIEQQALVNNLDKLTNAEGVLLYLKLQEGGTNSDPNEEVTTDEEDDGMTFGKFMKNNAVGFSVALAMLIGFGVYIGLDIYKKKRVGKTNTEEENFNDNGTEE